MEEEKVSSLPVDLPPLEARDTPKRGRRWFIWLLLLAVIGGGIAFWLTTHPADNRLSREAAAIEGLIPGKSDAEIQDILDEVVANGMVNISINQTPVFYGREGEIGIQNIPANHYSYTVTLTLDSSGEELYSSNLIDPGYYVNEITLNKRLSKGAHPATAVFHVYDVQEDADKQIATLTSAIHLSVLS